MLVQAVQVGLLQGGLFNGGFGIGQADVEVGEFWRLRNALMPRGRANEVRMFQSLFHLTMAGQQKGVAAAAQDGRVLTQAQQLRHAHRGDRLFGEMGHWQGGRWIRLEVVHWSHHPMPGTVRDGVSCETDVCAFGKAQLLRIR